MHSPRWSLPSGKERSTKTRCERWWNARPKQVSVCVPCGTTGESVALSGDEMEQVVRITVEQAAGRVPVIAGAGTNATAKTIANAERCQTAGADGLLLVCPYYNKPTQAGLIAHFRAVARGGAAADHALQHPRTHRSRHERRHGRATGGGRIHRRHQRGDRKCRSRAGAFSERGHPVAKRAQRRRRGSPFP